MPGSMALPYLKPALSPATTIEETGEVGLPPVSRTASAAPSRWLRSLAGWLPWLNARGPVGG